MVDFVITSLWNEIKADLLNGKSLIVSAPKNYGKTKFLLSLVNDSSIKERYQFRALLELDGFRGTKSKSLRLKPFYPTDESDPFTKISSCKDLINTLVATDHSSKVLLVTECNYRNKETTIDLLNNLQTLSRNLPNIFEDQIVIMVTDDLSLYYYERTPQSTHSLWDLFYLKFCIPAIPNPESIQNILSSHHIYQKDAAHISQTLYQITGGHHGLIYFALQYLFDKSASFSLINWKTELQNHLSSSNLLNSIRQIILKANLEMLQLALSFKTTRVNDWDANDNLVCLHQNGILLSTNDMCSQLCGGIISNLVEAVYFHKRENHNHDEIINLTTLSKHLDTNKSRADKRTQKAIEVLTVKIRRFMSERTLEEVVEEVQQLISIPPAANLAEKLSLIVAQYREIISEEIKGTKSDEYISLTKGKIRSNILKALKNIPYG